jgi:hypothetical protein
MIRQDSKAKYDKVAPEKGLKVKRKFLNRAKAIVPRDLDELDIQIGIACQIIQNLVEGSLLIDSRKGRS